MSRDITTGSEPHPQSNVTTAPEGAADTLDSNTRTRHTRFTMRSFIAAVLAVHGLAHLVGFVVPWRLAELDEMPYSTRVFGDRLDVGHSGIRLVGLLSLTAAVGYSIAATAIALKLPWWLAATLSTTVFSLVLCIVAWPRSRLGMVIDLAIRAILATGWIGGFHIFGLEAVEAGGPP